MGGERQYRAPPTLARFLLSDAFLRVVVGPFGSGKSSGCVVEFVRRAAAQAPGPDGIRRSRFAAVRNTYRQLKDTTQKTFNDWIPAGWGDWDSNFAFHLRVGDVESEILFRALDKPKDVKKLLSLELTGAYINELREIPQAIVDGLGGRIGRFPRVEDGGATWSGLWADTNPWHAGHWGHKLFEGRDPRLERIAEQRHVKLVARDDVGTVFELFRQPGGRDADAENLENLPPGYYQRLCAGKDSEWIRVYVDGQDAARAQGSIYGDLIDELERAGWIGEFNHGNTEVFTSWDLGRADATAIWFWRIIGKDKIEVIDHYENHLKPLSHYFDVVDGKGYRYIKHWLPHDAAAKTLASDSSVEEQCRAHWPGRVEIGPSLSVSDGIAAGRWLLEGGRCRFHERTRSGIEALQSYRREWDEDARAFGEKPLHDWSSHTADAWRYLAVVVKRSELISRKPPPVSSVVERLLQKPTLEQLFRENERSIHRPERIK